MTGTRIGRIRVIFKFPTFLEMHGVKVQTPAHWPKEPLAYIEWYTKPLLTPRALRTHKIPSLSKAYLPDGKSPAWSIISLLNVRQSAHLTPDFSKCPSVDWDIPISKSSVLDTCSHFLLNNWLSIYTYQSIYLA